MGFFPGCGAPMVDFVSLEERLAAYAHATSEPSTGRAEWWFLFAGLAFGAIAAMISTFVHDPAGQWISAIFVVLELIAFLVAAVYTLRSAWRTFHEPDATYAHELDRDYLLFREIVVWLRSLPAADTARRLRYLRDRRSSLVFRSGLFSGGVDRLGVLPVLALLYVQLKDWSFGDWQSLGKVHLLGGLLLLGLAVFYFVSWWAIRIRLRFDGYEALLAEAVAEPASVVEDASG